MKIKYFYASEAEIPDNVKALYEQKDGKWFLQCEGIPEPAKLAEFRDTNIALQKKLADLEKSFEGINADEARRLLAIKADLDAEKLMKKGDLDAAVASRLEPVKKDLEAKLEAERKRADEAVQKFNSHRLQSVVLEAATKLGVKSTATTDVLLRARETLAVEGEEIVVKLAGQTRYGANGATMTVDEWLAEQAKTSMVHLFEENKGGGSPGGNNPGKAGPSGNNPWKPETRNITEQNEIFKKDPALARKLAAAAGQKLPE